MPEVIRYISSNPSQNNNNNNTQQHPHYLTKFEEQKLGEKILQSQIDK
jgi:hypothetical protein